jgi:hypothetical protein
MVIPNYHSSSEALCGVSEQKCFYCVRLLASCQTPKLEDHSWSAVHNYLFNTFAANLHIWRPIPHPQPKGTCYSMVTGTHGWSTDILNNQLHYKIHTFFNMVSHASHTNISDIPTTINRKKNSIAVPLGLPSINNGPYGTE